MSKTLIAGDLHVHHKPYPDTLDRCMTMMDDITKVALLNGCDRIILNGDIFENHMPAWDTALRMYRWAMKTTSTGLTIVVNTGNHDYPSLVRPENPPILIFDGIPNVRVVDKYYVSVDCGEVVFWVVPWRPGAVFKAWMKKLVTQLHHDAINVLVAHQPITEAAVNAQGILVNQDLSLKDLHPDQFDWVILHDYHEHQWLLDNVFFGGAPMTHKFGDENQIGVWIYDSENNSWTSTELPTVVPRHITWDVTEGNLHLPNYEPINYNRIRCPSHLREEVMALYPGCYPIPVNQAIENDVTASRLSDVEEGDTEGTLDAFLDSKIFDHKPDRKVFKKLLNHYLIKVGALRTPTPKKKRKRRRGKRR